MNRMFCLSIAAVFLLGVVAVHGEKGSDEGVLAAIDCSNVQGINIAITIPDIAQWNSSDADAWALNDKNHTSCKPTFNQTLGQVKYTNVSVANCADEPTVSINDTKLEYEFQINVNAKADSGGPPVVFAYDHQYTIKCLYNRKQENVMASFEPQHSLQDNDTDDGDLSIVFRLSRTSDNSQINADDIIPLGTGIRGVVLVEASGFPSLDVHLQSVTASSDKAGSDSFALITDGCPEGNGLVDNTECDANEDESFKMATKGAFRFPDQTAGDKVWLKATAIVCLTSDNTSKCATECKDCNSQNRNRRETVQESLQTKYYVSAGPFRIANSNEESAADKVVKDKGAAVPSYAIAIVAICGVVAIAIASAVVVIVLRRRRQNTIILERRDAGVTA